MTVVFRRQWSPQAESHAMRLDAMVGASRHKWLPEGDNIVSQVLRKFGGQFVGKSRKDAYWIARRLLKKTFADYRRGRSAGASKVACRANNCFGCCLRSTPARMRST